MDHLRKHIELQLWQAAASTSGAALTWRARLRPFQHLFFYAFAGAGTFLLGRWAGALLLQLMP
jgi:hypothetical protein